MLDLVEAGGRGEPAWNRHPSWYLVATSGEAIPADAERMFAQRMGAHTVEIPSSHLAMVSHPDEVVKLISERNRQRVSSSCLRGANRPRPY